MTKRYSIAEARDHLPSIVREVERGGAVEIARRGTPVAVMLSVREYERLTGAKGGYWEAVQKWRQETDLEGMDEVIDAILASRDRSPGRDFSW